MLLASVLNFVVSELGYLREASYAISHFWDEEYVKRTLGRYVPKS